MNIFIFEDDQNDANHLKNYLKQFFTEHNFTYTINVTSNPNEIYSNLENIDLIFLDIEVNTFNGIEIGLEIRKRNKDVKIIITSLYSKYLIDGYKVYADRYFLKPIQKELFFIEMQSIYSEYILYNKNFIDLKISTDKIYFKDIIFIEMINRKSYLYKINGKKYETTYSIQYWINKLPSQFFVQIHRSFIVNMNMISNYNTKQIILINGREISLSRKYRDFFKKSYLNFMHNKY